MYQHAGGCAHATDTDTDTDKYHLKSARSALRSWGADRIDIAAEINAARNALLAMSPEERASHLKRTARGDGGALLLGPQSADRCVMHSKCPGDIS